MLQSLLQHWKGKLSRVTSSGKYIWEVDGLRFLAILPVIIQHLSERMIRNTPIEFATPVEQDQLAFLASRGTIGVFLFFAISGFILAFPFAKYHLMDGRKIGLKDYFIRRLTRLEPPYIIWMTVFFIVLLIKTDEAFGAMFLHYLSSIFYVHAFAYGEYSPINPVAWSLEIEIQFYILAPLLTALFFQIKNKWLRRSVLIASIFGFITMQNYFGWWVAPYKMTILGQMQHFLIGFLAVDFYLFDWRHSDRKSSWLDILAIVALFVMAYTWTTEYWKNLVFSTALFCIFIAAFQGNYFRRFIRISWVAIIGGMCYTIYLIHLPLLELLILGTKHITLTNYYIVNLLLQMVIVVPLIIVFSAIAFYWLEKPFMKKDWHLQLWKNMKSRFQKNQVKEQIMTKTNLMILLLLLGGLSANAQATLDSTAVDSITSQLKNTPNQDAEDIFEIRPMEELIALALLHSPALKEQDLVIQQRGHEASLSKRRWADLLTATAGWNRGTTNLLDENNDGATVNYLLVNRTNSFYNFGFQLRLSPADIVNQRDKTQITKLEIEKAKIRKQGIEFGLREEVIRRYHMLMTALQLIEIKADLVESNELALKITEKYFKEGNYPASEYTTLLSKTTAAKEELLKAKNTAKMAYQMLEELVGTSIRRNKN